MKNLFNDCIEREVQKFNVSVTFSVMRKVIDLLGVIGVIFAISYSYVSDIDFGIMLAMVLGVILLVQLLLLPGYIAQHKTSPRTTGIFVLSIIIWLIPITWPAALVWACAEPYCNQEVKPVEKKKFITFQIISTIIIALVSILFYFAVCHENICETRKIKAEKSKIEKAVNVYHKEHYKEMAKQYGVSEKCYADYQKIIELEGEVAENNYPCSPKENQQIKSYLKRMQDEASNREYALDDVPEPLWTNGGMPKSLVLKDVPIMCFEKANLGDNSKCTEKQLNTIKEFYKNNHELDWEKEYFEY